MLSEKFLKPLVPLVAAIIGGLIASGSAYLIQSKTTDLTLRLQQEEKELRTKQLIRTKLEKALYNVTEMAAFSVCLTAEYERHGTPARCPIAMETALEASVLAHVYALELRDTSEAVLESYYAIEFFLDDEGHQAPMEEWPDDDTDEFKELRDEFDDHFGGFADALVEEIRKNF